MSTSVVKIKPIDTRTMSVWIRGLTPLISHKFSEKSKKQMRDKKAGKKVKVREPCDPEAEYEAATYFLTDGSCGVPATSIKAAISGAAHKDIGFPKTVIRRGLFVHADDTPSGGVPLLRLHNTERVMREDTVKVGMGSTDLRYRPEYSKWEIELRIEYDTEWLEPDTIIALLQRAGFGIGIGEWRPEKGGDFGRFEIVSHKESKDG